MPSSEWVLEELHVRSSQWHRESEASVNYFITLTEEKYTSEIYRFLHFYGSDKLLGPLLRPVLEEIREYLLWLRWVGWNISNLGPALHREPGIPAERLALAMLAYVAGRLVDDGLDNHKHYKGHRKTIVAIVADRLPESSSHTGCVQSVFIGFCLFNYAQHRMHESGHQHCAHLVQQLFEVSSVGVLAEHYVGSKVSEHLYRQIVGRKAVAYNMVLYKPFLEGTEEDLRLELLRILAEIDELAQIINDYNDIAEDSAAGQMNAFTHGVFDAAGLQSEILVRAHEMLTTTALWSRPLRGGLAMMLENSGIIPFVEKRVANGDHDSSGVSCDALKSSPIDS